MAQARRAAVPFRSAGRMWTWTSWRNP